MDGTSQCDSQMNDLTPEKVREFLICRYGQSISGAGANPAELPDAFDFLLSGVIDSFGILEMIEEIENEFEIQLDLTNLSAEEFTVLGPLSRFIAANAKAG